MLSCEIQGLPTYKLRLQGACTQPKVQCNFASFDFGALFVPSSADAPFASSPVPPRISAVKVLKITNQDAHHECVISSTFFPSEFLDFQLAPVSLSPDETIQVPITFSPKAPGVYKAKLPLLVNDKPVTTIHVAGRAVPVRWVAKKSLSPAAAAASCLAKKAFTSRRTWLSATFFAALKCTPPKTTSSSSSPSFAAEGRREAFPFPTSRKSRFRFSCEVQTTSWSEKRLEARFPCDLAGSAW